ncbi:class I SAM-dependent methyltransferase [bacterium]|nr:MAG: class I SAM-dependent methyltransferase [bacterium]
MRISNQSIIDEWSEFSKEDLIAFSDDGDSDRVSLLDPNIISLAGEIKGRRVLDAGCGNGYLSRKLAMLGAVVTGVEPSNNLFRYCSEKEREAPLGITYMQCDLSKMELNEEYDLVVLINVLMDIPEYQTALVNCIKVLKPGGEVIISILHPCFPGSESDWKNTGYVQVREYFDAPPIKQKYGYLITRPIQDYFNVLIENSCVIQRVIEPRQLEWLSECPCAAILNDKSEKKALNE